MPQLQHLAPDLFTISGLLGPEECRDMILRAEKIGFEEATVGEAMIKEIRNNARVVFADSTLADCLWQRAKPVLEAKNNMNGAVGFSSRFRIYRYTPGESFNWHYDGNHREADGNRALVTCIIYLNEDYDGGETRFKKFIIKPQRGMALFFHHEYMHKGEEVQRGIKYVLRTDVLFSPATHEESE